MVDLELVEDATDGALPGLPGLLVPNGVSSVGTTLDEALRCFFLPAVCTGSEVHSGNSTAFFCSSGGSLTLHAKPLPLSDDFRVTTGKVTVVLKSAGCSGCIASDEEESWLHGELESLDGHTRSIIAPTSCAVGPKHRYQTRDVVEPHSHDVKAVGNHL